MHNQTLEVESRWELSRRHECVDFMCFLMTIILCRLGIGLPPCNTRVETAWFSSARYLWRFEPIFHVHKLCGNHSWIIEIMQRNQTESMVCLHLICAMVLNQGLILAKNRQFKKQVEITWRKTASQTPVGVYVDSLYQHFRVFII